MGTLRVCVNPRPKRRIKVVAAVSPFALAGAAVFLRAYPAVSHLRSQAQIFPFPTLTPMWILIAEDESSMGDLLTQGLQEQNHTVTLARNGEEALAALATTNFDAIVLDVMMPHVNGLEVARRLRAAKNHTPILMLTARDAPNDIVAGLDAGADDYLVKPFSLSVLLARLRSITRRSAQPPIKDLRAGPLCLDPASREVSLHGKKVPLTPTEFRLLELLMRRPNRAISRSAIIEAVWGFDQDVNQYC